MKLIVFDVDGTLTRTVEVDADCYVRAFADIFGIRGIDTDWSRYRDYTDGGIAREIFETKRRRAPSPEDVARLVGRFIALLAAAGEKDPSLFSPVPGAAEAIRGLEEDGTFRLALATGCWLASARLKLQLAGLKLDHLPIATSDDALNRSAILKLAVERAGKPPQGRWEKVVYLGDGVWDVRTTRALGMPFLGVGDAERIAKMRAEGARQFIPDFQNYQAFLDGLAAAEVPG
ncbi:MAG: haloacid dehalogenase-like hydrolase [Candidatus Aureabacteria bacterium]|nr:haloacid dehalogenase-like hydrolase [Candidatus Auribacterota bacterium]